MGYYGSRRKWLRQDRKWLKLKYESDHPERKGALQTEKRGKTFWPQQVCKRVSGYRPWEKGVLHEWNTQKLGQWTGGDLTALYVSACGEWSPSRRSPQKEMEMDSLIIVLGMELNLFQVSSLLAKEIMCLVCYWAHLQDNTMGNVCDHSVPPWKKNPVSGFDAALVVWQYGDTYSVRTHRYLVLLVTYLIIYKHYPFKNL